MQPGDYPPPTPGTAVAAPPPVSADRRVPCPRCGELAESGQEVCLRCGALVGRAYERPPGWRLPAALAALGVLLIGAGAGFGVAELTHDNDKDKKKPISLTPKRPVAPVAPPVATTAPTTTAPTTTAPTTTNTAPTTTDTTPSGGAGSLTTWPTGQHGWTVLLITTSDKAEAEKSARNAAKESISAGIFDSDDYKGFQKDSWVAFMGQYSSKAAAKRAAKSYKDKGFSGTPTEITPKPKKSE
jgi:SPOR domain